ncbi:Acyl-CoA carboxylase epsilon subunit [Jatrophihabitans endophyticus]|uniref:Acyl-CoA carboxylase epsilon subunit n=1 Tax=Jatrophihabitans endophyticus TaxID=1206085 RepID=A0A1M5UEC3_9ACTN|nr:acyl-CoA carboxylase subunit epsilon [Jatrophihabitans endophyticus]SHH61405.1 Acyl-CoA carboxylase epsilon subunit [Jatrophihabitans endophyticus]
MSDPQPGGRPPLRIVRGEPTAEEIAVLTAVVAVAGGGDDAPRSRERRGNWSDPGMLARRTLRPGPNGWRAAFR